MDKSEKNKEKDRKQKAGRIWRDEHAPHTASSGHLFGGRYWTPEEIRKEWKDKKH